MFVAFTDFCGVNTPTVANFRLPANMILLKEELEGDAR